MENSPPFEGMLVLNCWHYLNSHLIFLPYLILNFQLLYLVMLFSTILRISLLQLLESFSGNNKLIHEKFSPLKQTGWLRFTHPLLQTCQISALNPLWVLGSEIQEKKNLDLLTSWAPLKRTSGTGMRTISYMHHTNSTLPQFTLPSPAIQQEPGPFSICPCSAGKKVCWDKKLQSCAVCMDLLTQRKLFTQTGSHPRQKLKILQMQNTTVR